MKKKNDTKKKNFESIESLNPVAVIIEEAGEAIEDKTRNILNSPISDVLLAAGGVTGGVVVDIAVISFIAGKYAGKLSMPALLHILKVIGQGSAKRGLLFLAIPAVVFAAGGAILARYINNNRLVMAKKRLLQEAVAKLHGILKAQKEEIEADRLRADELQKLNIILTVYIAKLEEDLEDEEGPEDDAAEGGTTAHA
jgi:hypothetical protein